MEEVIIFKKGVDISKATENLRLSNNTPYRLYFPLNAEQLMKICQTNKLMVMYYLAEILSEEDRILISKIKSNHGKIKICLFSNQAYAIDAWRLNLFHFEEYPVSALKLMHSFQKYLTENSVKEQDFILIKEEGIAEKIALNDVSYLVGSGNYTYIHLENDKKKFITKQLGQFEYIADMQAWFQRVHKSYIINLQKIQSLGNNQVFFHNSIKPLVVSGNLEAKLKRIILEK